MSKKSKRVLFISQRLPEIENSEKEYIRILHKIAANNEVDIAYMSGMFTDADTVREYGKSGFKVLDLREEGDKAGIDSRLQEIFSDKKYDLIMFKSKYDAKYYLPYIKDYSPDTITVLFTGYEYYLQYLQQAGVKNDKDFLGQLAERINKTAVFNFVDYIIVDSKPAKDIIEKCTYEPEVLVFESGNFSLNSLVKKTGPYTQNDIEVALIKEQHDNETISVINSCTGENFQIEHYDNEDNLICTYNKALRQSRGEFIFISVSDTMTSDLTLYTMRQCLKGNPQVGIVEVGADDRVESFDKSHFLSKQRRHHRRFFADWFSVDKLKQKCSLMKKVMIEKVGVLNEDFRTLEIAKIDFAWRVLQDGYKMVVCGDTMIFSKNESTAEPDKADFEQDFKILTKLWKEKRPDLLKDFCSGATK